MFRTSNGIFYYKGILVCSELSFIEFSSFVVELTAINALYNQRKTNRVNNVAPTSPPMMTTAKGRWLSEPMP